MESEAIKNRSAAYLLKKRRPRGEEGRKGMRRGGSGGEKRETGEGGWEGGRQSVVFNFFCC